METTIIGNILGLYRDSGKENGSYCRRFWDYGFRVWGFGFLGFRGFIGECRITAFELLETIFSGRLAAAKTMSLCEMV